MRWRSVLILLALTSVACNQPDETIANSPSGVPSTLNEQTQTVERPQVATTTAPPFDPSTLKAGLNLVTEGGRAWFGFTALGPGEAIEGAEVHKSACIEIDGRPSIEPDPSTLLAGSEVGEILQPFEGSNDFLVWINTHDAGAAYSKVVDAILGCDGESESDHFIQLWPLEFGTAGDESFAAQIVILDYEAHHDADRANVVVTDIGIISYDSTLIVAAGIQPGGGHTGPPETFDIASVPASDSTLVHAVFGAVSDN